MDKQAPPPDDAALAERIAALASDVHSQDVEHRRVAVRHIHDVCFRMEHRARAAIPILIGCLSDPDEEVSDSALWGLTYCAPGSIEPLVACLDSTNAVVRRRAGCALGNIGAAAIPACDSLRTLLKGAVRDVRLSSALALGLITDTSLSTVAALFEMAGSESPAEKSAAFHARQH
jgi:HEAT repeat protein